MLEELKELASEFNKLKDDKTKWEFIIQHKDKFVVMLDNDSTLVAFNHDLELSQDDWDFIDENYDDFKLKSFNDYIGWDIGIIALLDAVGIKSEGV